MVKFGVKGGEVNLKENARMRAATCTGPCFTHIHLHCVCTGNEAGYSGEDMVVACRPTDTVSR